ncbi:MAG: hypothetical protein ABEJ03_00740 [Candidatus Nanohaloarchaea archaeon]
MTGLPNRNFWLLNGVDRSWQLALTIAVFNDLLDLAGIGAVPIIGDVLDLPSSALLWRFLGRNYTVPTLFELIPGMDFVPTYTLTVIYAYYREEYR